MRGWSVIHGLLRNSYYRYDVGLHEAMISLGVGKLKDEVVYTLAWRLTEVAAMADVLRFTTLLSLIFVGVLSLPAQRSPQLLLLYGIGPIADIEKVTVPVVHDNHLVGNKSERCYARLHPRAVNCRKKKCGVLDESHDDAPLAKDGEVATVDATPNSSRIWKRKTKRAKKKKKNSKWSVCLLLNQKLKQSTLCHLEECTRSRSLHSSTIEEQKSNTSFLNVAGNIEVHESMQWDNEKDPTTYRNAKVANHLIGQDASLVAFPIEELIEKSDGFVGFFAFTDSLTSSNATIIIPGKR
ncbi:cation-transporting P-type ATPase [Tanacetum coccineum]